MEVCPPRYRGFLFASEVQGVRSEQGCRIDYGKMGGHGDRVHDGSLSDDPVGYD